MNKSPWTRRQFIRVGTGAAAVGATGKFTLLQPKPLWASPQPVAPVTPFASHRLAPGVRGCELLGASSHVPGIECVAVCDLYDSRHTAAQEAVKNPSVPATRNYKEILDRKDVDAVIIAVTDH